VANGPGKDTADDVVVMVTEVRPADSEDTRPIHLPLTWSGTSPSLTVSAVHPGSARHIDLLHVDLTRVFWDGKRSGGAAIWDHLRVEPPQKAP
jgi:hypothetical protein